MVFRSKKEFDAAVDKMAKELKEYVDEGTFFLWTDDICDIIDQNLGSTFKKAMRIYNVAEWEIMDKNQEEEVEPV